MPYSPPTSGGSNHTGAIAGGAAGGVVVLVLTIVLILFFWRRRRPEEPGAIFYPDRVVRQADPHTDLEGAGITPFSYTPTTGTFSAEPSSPTFSADGSMRQYHDSQALFGGGMAGAGAATGTTGPHYSPTSSGGDGSRRNLKGAEVTPFSYTPTTGTFSAGSASPTFSADGSMRQYPNSQVPFGGGMAGTGAAMGTTGPHYAPTSSSGDGSADPPGSASHARSSSLGSGGLGPAGSPVAQPHRAPLSPKEGGLGLATTIEEDEGTIVQHSDGGRVLDSEPIDPNRRVVQEIPPSYDSIPGNP